MLAGFVLVQLLLHLGLAVAAGAHKILPGVIETIFEQRGSRLRYFQLLLNGLAIFAGRSWRLAW